MEDKKSELKSIKLELENSAYLSQNPSFCIEFSEQNHSFYIEFDEQNKLETIFEKINKFLINNNYIQSREDKLIGRWFIKTEKINGKNCVALEVFRDKIAFYLWDSIFRKNRRPLEDIGLQGINTYRDFSERFLEFIDKVFNSDNQSAQNSTFTLKIIFNSTNKEDESLKNQPLNVTKKSNIATNDKLFAWLKQLNIDEDENILRELSEDLRSGKFKIMPAYTIYTDREEKESNKQKIYAMFIYYDKLHEIYDGSDLKHKNVPTNFTDPTDFIPHLCDNENNENSVLYAYVKRDIVNNFLNQHYQVHYDDLNAFLEFLEKNKERYNKFREHLQTLKEYKLYTAFVEFLKNLDNSLVIKDPYKDKDKDKGYEKPHFQYIYEKNKSVHTVTSKLLDIYSKPDELETLYNTLKGKLSDLEKNYPIDIKILNIQETNKKCDELSEVLKKLGIEIKQNKTEHQ